MVVETVVCMRYRRRLKIENEGGITLRLLGAFGFYVGWVGWAL